MSAPRQRSLHFVNISQPAVGDARSAQQQARSHSAREAHARARRLQVEKYQRHSAVQQAEGSRLDCQDVAMEILPKGPFLAMSSNAEDLERGLADIFSPVNQLVSNCKDPFSCSAISLTPTDHFLLDHYVKVVLPGMNKNCVIFQSAVNNSYLMPLDWVKLSLTDVGLLYGILLGSCRYLCAVQHQEHNFMRLAIQYKLASMRQLRAAIMKEASFFDDSTVGNVMALAIDEMALGDLEVARNHVSGATRMVEFNGGPQTLGLNGFLGFLLDRLLNNKGLFDNQPPLGSA